MPLICNTGHANLIWPFVAWFDSAKVFQKQEHTFRVRDLQIKLQIKIPKTYLRENVVINVQELPKLFMI